MWQCESCGAQFPSIPTDETAKRCSSCVQVEHLERLLGRVTGQLWAAQQDADRLRAALHDIAHDTQIETGPLRERARKALSGERAP